MIKKRYRKGSTFWQFRRATTLVNLKVGLLGGFTYCYTVILLINRYRLFNIGVFIPDFYSGLHQ